MEQDQDMLDGLRDLLARQLALVRRGCLVEALTLFGETDRHVQAILRARLHETPDQQEQWPDLERLYQELSVALAAQQAEVSAALAALQQRGKLLRTYGMSAAAS